ncbi:MAG: multiprotein bridging factor aMBF1 [Desulfurococcales archaeon]|nr:multiprotein bridging factor aMBF1 [Desulfurococcales archaeon]
MSRSETLYCEMCGSPIVGRPYRAIVDGVEMVLCASCYLKLTRSGRAVPVRERPRRAKAASRQPKRPTRKVSIELLDLVEDYPEIIRRAREAKGWDLRTLAQKLRISETMLRRIEQGKYKPPIDLARRIEKILKIKILEPTELEDEYEAPPPGKLTLGDVVIIRRDED